MNSYRVRSGGGRDTIALMIRKMLGVAAALSAPGVALTIASERVIRPRVFYTGSWHEEPPDAVGWPYEPNGDTLLMVEVKAGRTVRSTDAAPLVALATASMRTAVERVIVHRSGRTHAVTRVVAPGVRSATIEELVLRLQKG